MLLAWILCGATLCAAPVENKPLNLTAMTFNVRFGTADDKENDWEHRKDILVRTIKQYAPDIMGAQECLDFQAAYVSAQLPEYRWMGVGREKGLDGEMTAIFYKADALFPLESGHYWLSENPALPGPTAWDAACSRMVSWVRFYHPATGKQFYHLNTHFDHKGNQARIESAKLMAKRLKKMEALPAILTGDFNADAEKSDAWKTFQTAGMTDAWLSAGERIGPQGTFHGFEGPAKNKEGSRIDWILTLGKIKAISMETVTYQENGHYPSDHYPVAARLMVE